MRAGLGLRACRHDQAPFPMTKKEDPMPGSKRAKTAYWIFTILFCLMMGFTVYAQLFLPQVAQVFSHLGFPNYFRIELCWAKVAGLVVLILPMAPPRLEEGGY